MFKKALFAAAAAGTALVAMPASAATLVGNINLNIGNCATVCSGTFSNAAGTPSFDDYFTVNFPNMGTAASQVGEITVAGNVNFSSVYLQAAGGGTQYNFTITNGNPSQARLLPVGPLASGNYNLFIAGTNTVAGNAYSGTITLAAVPEPAAWALFILGFGLVGGAMRRRSQTARSTKASITFA